MFRESPPLSYLNPQEGVLIDPGRSLFRGNLVLECPVPTPLLDLCPIEHRKEQEFALMRYTAVTCGPDDFAVSRGCGRGGDGWLIGLGG